MLAKRVITSVLTRLSQHLLVGRFFRLFIKLFRPLSPALLYRIAARSYRINGKHDIASGISQRGTEQFPDNVPLRIEHGDCLLQGGEHQRAAIVFNALIENKQARKLESVWLKLAKSYQLQNKHETAELIFLEACRLFPTNQAIITAGAKNAYHIKDWESAKVRWKSLLEIGVSLGAKEILWAARSFHSTGDIKDARTLLDRVIEDRVYGLDALLEFALIETEAQNYKKALQLWKKLKQQNPKTAPLSVTRTSDFNISIISRILDPSAYKKRIEAYSTATKKQQPKIVVYTSYTSGYDILKPHQHIDSRFEYVVFTDDTPNDYGLYEVKPLPTNHRDGRVSTRYPKTHPHELFPNHDVAIWLDTSIMIVDDIYPIIKDFIASGKAVGTTPHTHRAGLFEEFVVCMERDKDSYANLKSLYDFYAKIGYKYNNLSENGFLLFRPQHHNLQTALELWWKMILKYSKRDQLSFGYSLAKAGLDWYRISEPPDNINNNPAFIITPHKQSLDVIYELEKRLV